MPIYLKQSTASQEIPLGVFVDDTDGKTAETGLTIANTDIFPCLYDLCLLNRDS